VLMPWLAHVGAVLAAWYPGQHGGEAIARILTGEVNPSGRLPMTFPSAIEQTPNPLLPGSNLGGNVQSDNLYAPPTHPQPFDVSYPEGADVGHRWYDRTNATPLFAFGHGLSYTQFSYSDLALRGGANIEASFNITNTGARRGVEVAQVYARIHGVRRLIGWSRTDLAPGETKRVIVSAEPRVLSDFDVRDHNWRIAAGTYDVEVSAAVNAPRLNGEARLDERRIAP